MTNKGPNRDSHHHVKSQAKREQNDKDEAVSRDPDIRGVNKSARDERGPRGGRG